MLLEGLWCALVCLHGARCYQGGYQGKALVYPVDT